MIPTTLSWGCAPLTISRLESARYYAIVTTWPADHLICKLYTRTRAHGYIYRINWSAGHLVPYWVHDFDALYSFICPEKSYPLLHILNICSTFAAQKPHYRQMYTSGWQTVKTAGTLHTHAPLLLTDTTVSWESGWGGLCEHNKKRLLTLVVRPLKPEKFHKSFGYKTLADAHGCIHTLVRALCGMHRGRRDWIYARGFLHVFSMARFSQDLNGGLTNGSPRFLYAYMWTQTYNQNK